MLLLGAIGAEETLLFNSQSTAGAFLLSADLGSISAPRLGSECSQSFHAYRSGGREGQHVVGK